MAVRIAMWSGPRNISTAMMRSFGARADTLVVDEPFYAAYLAVTGRDDPGRAEVLASQCTDTQLVAAELLAPLPDGVEVHYQKHMAQHLLPGFGGEWLASLRHAHLIRDPAHVIASYARVREAPTLEDLGFRQQVELYRTYGGPVVDADDVLRDPPGTLAALCGALDIPFEEKMLAWPAGSRPTDGVWAPHWYANVEASSGFAPYSPSAAKVPEHLQHLVEAAQPAYAELSRYRLTA